MIQDVAPLRFDNAFIPASPAVDDLVLDLSADGLLLLNGLPPTVEAWRKSPARQNAALLYAFRLTTEEDASPSRPASDTFRTASAVACSASEASDTARETEKGIADLPLPARETEKDAAAPGCASAPARETDAPSALLRRERPETRFFLVLRAGDSDAPTPDSWRRVAPRDLRTAPAPLPLVAATAAHLFRWYDTTRFCPRCASPLKHAEKERALACPSCGHILYPVIAPCVIVAVTHEDRLLLTRYARPGAKHLVLVAGFIEIGETAEQAAAREVMEETGLRIKNLRYQGSQPWGFSGSLVSAFSAELDGPDTIRLDTSELAEARWVRRADIPPCPALDSFTMHLIHRFARGEL